MAILTLAEYKAYYGLSGLRQIGSGLDDITVSGVDDNTPSKTWLVEITSEATPDVFKWSNDGGNTYTTSVSITGSAQHLSDGVKITFAATTGHTSGDVWKWVTSAVKDDSALQTCISDAEVDWANETHRVWEDPGSDATRYFDCKEPIVKGDTLYLDRDLYSITSVTNGDDDTLTSSEYVTEPRNSADAPYWAIKLRSDSGLAWTYQTNWENAITVVGRWCYNTTTPRDVTAVIRELAGYYAESRGLHGGVKTGPGGEEVRLSEDWPPYCRRMLQRYRRV